VTIGQRVRARRQELGLSQQEVAFRAGISIGIVHRLETGRTTDPHFSTLEGLAKALSINVEDLVRKEESPGPLAPAVA
jgi:transcriptional regulator with XRE-family HTH domain